MRLMYNTIIYNIVHPSDSYRQKFHTQIVDTQLLSLAHGNAGNEVSEWYDATKYKVVSESTIFTTIIIHILCGKKGSYGTCFNVTIIL